MPKDRVVIGSYSDSRRLWGIVCSHFSASAKTVKYWSKGETHSAKLNDSPTLMFDDGTNEAKVLLKSGNLYFFPSPLLDGWGKLQGYDGLSRSAVQAQRSYLSFENSLKLNEINKYPATVVYEGSDFVSVFDAFSKIACAPNGGAIDFVWQLGEGSTALFEPLTSLAPSPKMYMELDKMAIKGTKQAFLRGVDATKILSIDDFQTLSVSP